MKKTILTAFMLFTTLLCIAQVSSEKRIELEFESIHFEENLIDLGKNGFIVRSQHNSTSSEIVWKYQLFDTNLESVKTKEITVEKGFRNFTSYYTDGHVHMFFGDGTGKYELITLEIPSLEVARVQGQLPAKVKTSSMKVLGDYAFLETYKKRRTLSKHPDAKQVEYLFIVNWKKDNDVLTPKILNDFERGNVFINNMQINEVTDEITVHAEGVIHWGYKEDYIIRFDSKGKKTAEIPLNAGQKVSNISTGKFGDGQEVIVGTFGKARYSNSAMSVRYSDGIYFEVSDGSQVSSSRIYKFTKLKNFFSHIRTIHKEIGAVYPEDYLKLTMHDIVSLDDGYLVVGEVYYPIYSGGGILEPTSTPVFVGYQYTHATIIKLDKIGNIKWDRTFKMWNQTDSSEPVKFLSTVADENSIKLVSIVDNTITSKEINYDGDVLQSEGAKPMEMSKEGDKRRWTLPDIRHWYDDYFIAYGTQKIKNDETGKRKVFFVNKIKYE